MIKKYLILNLILAATAVGLVLSILFDSSVRPSRTESAAAISSFSNPPGFNLVDKINEAVDFLKHQPPLKYEVDRKGNLLKKQIALALLNEKTGEIREKIFWLDENEIENYGKTGVINMTPDSPDGPTVDLLWWNSFNSNYKVEEPGFIVLANRYLLESKYIKSLPEVSRTKYTEIVYMPYSEDLQTPEVVQAGKDYINRQVEDAFRQLDLLKVASKDEPDKNVTREISKDFVKNILLVEHVDPDLFSTAIDGGLSLTQRVMTIIGSNQASAYRYTGSPAGANGIAQFIKPTYDGLVSGYPQAKLIRDYGLGVADHVNAIKAMVLFFDSHKKELEDKTSRQTLVKQLGISEEMLAAAYNGGPSRVVRSIDKYGNAWLNSQVDLPENSRILRDETITYLKKFTSIKNLNIF